MSPPLAVAAIGLNPAIDQHIGIAVFTAGALNRVSREETHAGGKAVNVAACLADLGVGVALTGLLGSDNAEVFERLFASKGIHDRCVRFPGRTRSNIKIVSGAPPQVTEINFPANFAGEGYLAGVQRAVDALLDDCSCFVLAGSLPAGIPATCCGELIGRLRAAGKRVALDSSGAALRHGVAATPWLIKPNLAELEELVGDDLPNPAAAATVARRLVAGGIEQVVVSLGERGALFVTADRCLQAIPPPTIVNSTVGAGDALLAGQIAGWLRGWSLADSARLAIACASARLGMIGSGLPPRPQLAALMAGVELREPDRD
ncbi:1-phosphofructokinase family hexose kinase [Accumulibacter sp.]|uniref:1-phosphofructokinase family hexose kinase n=1 Tax=Accumulibacter sp. TaxID=2053492 RepID=UPI0025E03682|nr:1-phosphofructokinase family hexose kinase [Accumulibacter sp.]MCM8610505.1 1-phosphofructokinase family hexose kinase [Accumulibacter sp.]MCM8634405.1 1-phosphofructokinase family hexose kinase [Accumulibacter sp.]MCM8641598.1 1-phosphofructokinase family hexose kinase [Accumulibacter sp.]